MIALRFCIPIFFALPLLGKTAEPHHWAEGTPGLPNGATRDYYNRAAVLPWNHFMGDWWDADGNAQGDAAFATAEVTDDDSEKPIEWEVTNMVRDWLDGSVRNQGFFLRTIGKKGNIVFLSREHPNHGAHPELIITGSGGEMTQLTPEADTFLTKSTYRSQGDAHERSAVRDVNYTPVHAFGVFIARTSPA